MYRRRQRLFVEMEQMASRPFSQVCVELERGGAGMYLKHFYWNNDFRMVGIKVDLILMFFELVLCGKMCGFCTLMPLK